MVRRVFLNSEAILRVMGRGERIAGAYDFDMRRFDVTSGKRTTPATRGQSQELDY